MSDPIINPLYLYLIDISGGIKALMAVISAVSFICLGVSSSFLFQFKKRIALPIVATLMFFALLCALTSALVPSKAGLISIFVANELTYERLDLAISSGGGLKEVIKDDIIEIFQSLNSKGGDE